MGDSRPVLGAVQHADDGHDLALVTVDQQVRRVRHGELTGARLPPDTPQLSVDQEQLRCRQDSSRDARRRGGLLTRYVDPQRL